MRKRRGAEEVARWLKDADRDLVKGLTVADIRRKIGVAQTTYYRWRRTHDPSRSMPTDAAASLKPKSIGSSGSSPN